MSEIDPQVSAWVERVFLALISLLATVFGVRATFEAKRLEAQLTLAAKTLETKAKREDTTETHLLEAWKLEREIVLAERDALRKERELSQAERESARLARAAEEGARRAAALDNELATIAVEKNASCQERLVQVVARLETLEREHAGCPSKIQQLERDVALLQFTRGEQI